MPAQEESRAEQLLRLAADLFASRGFPSVGIGAIGEAAGISGPAVYRYYRSKEAILEAICDRTMNRMLEGAEEIAHEYADPRLGLEALVNLHVNFAVEERTMLGVWVREQRHLSPDMRKSLRQRRRAYEMPWRRVMTQLRPDMDEAEIQLAVYAAIAMLNGSVVPDTELSGQRLRTLLRRMALTSLLVRRAPGTELGLENGQDVPESVPAR